MIFMKKKFKKSHARGTKNLKDGKLMIFYHLYFAKKVVKGFSNKNHKNIVAVFPTGSKKRKPNNDDKQYHGQGKSRPSTLC